MAVTAMVANVSSINENKNENNYVNKRNAWESMFNGIMLCFFIYDNPSHSIISMQTILRRTCDKWANLGIKCGTLQESFGCRCEGCICHKESDNEKKVKYCDVSMYIISI